MWERKWKSGEIKVQLEIKTLSLHSNSIFIEYRKYVDKLICRKEKR